MVWGAADGAGRNGCPLKLMAGHFSRSLRHKVARNAKDNTGEKGEVEDEGAMMSMMEECRCNREEQENWGKEKKRKEKKKEKKKGVFY